MRTTVHVMHVNFDEIYGFSWQFRMKRRFTDFLPQFFDEFNKVVCSVSWPLNGSETGGDLALIQTFLPLLCKCT